MPKKSVSTGQRFGAAGKDCFIGKRIAAAVNFDETYGITVTFIPATHFVFTTHHANQNQLTAFVYFQIIDDNDQAALKRIYKKKYTLENGIVYVEESIFDGGGLLQESVIEKQPTLLTEIPAVIFINDGLTGEWQGESEIATLEHYEEWFSKLANADIDAGRKSMNPIRYTVNMSSESTNGLRSRPGEYWDLQSEQNLDRGNPMIGVLENSMTYSEALKTTLERVKTSAFETVTSG